MKKTETLIVNKTMDWLKAEGGWWFKVHGSIFQISGIPDILGCYHGRFIGIEMKVPGKEATTLQKYVIKEIIKAGGRAGVAVNYMEARSIRDGKPF